LTSVSGAGSPFPGAAAVETLAPLRGGAFDRLLVAQARVEPFRLLSADPQVMLYGEGVVRV
jgi:PIN domain nuclease of toxin-antitoxin system